MNPSKSHSKPNALYQPPKSSAALSHEKLEEISSQKVAEQIFSPASISSGESAMKAFESSMQNNQRVSKQAQERFQGITECNRNKEEEPPNNGNKDDWHMAVLNPR